MATIRAITRASTTRVIVAGRLAARDVRRLEHACAPALTSAHADLVVDMERVTYVAPIAAALVGRIAARGAVVKGPK
jgi:hypothetical protein